MNPCCQDTQGYECLSLGCPGSKGWWLRTCHFLPSQSCPPLWASCPCLPGNDLLPPCNSSDSSGLGIQPPRGRGREALGQERGLCLVYPTWATPSAQCPERPHHSSAHLHVTCLVAGLPLPPNCDLQGRDRSVSVLIRAHALCWVPSPKQRVCMARRFSAKLYIHTSTAMTFLTQKSHLQPYSPPEITVHDAHHKTASSPILFSPLPSASPTLQLLFLSPVV